MAIPKKIRRGRRAGVPTAAIVSAGEVFFWRRATYGDSWAELASWGNEKPVGKNRGVWNRSQVRRAVIVYAGEEGLEMPSSSTLFS